VLFLLFLLLVLLKAEAAAQEEEEKEEEADAGKMVATATEDARGTQGRDALATNMR
jgi:hypothetical protein